MTSLGPDGHPLLGDRLPHREAEWDQREGHDREGRDEEAHSDAELFDAYLTKPVDHDALTGLLAVWYDKASGPEDRKMPEPPIGILA
jgi:hypothetical protein